MTLVLRPGAVGQEDHKRIHH